MKTSKVIAAILALFITTSGIAQAGPGAPAPCSKATATTYVPKKGTLGNFAGAEFAADQQLRDADVGLFQRGYVEEETYYTFTPGCPQGRAGVHVNNGWHPTAKRKLLKKDTEYSLGGVLFVETPRTVATFFSGSNFGKTSTVTQKVTGGNATGGSASATGGKAFSTASAASSSASSSGASATLGKLMGGKKKGGGW